MNITHHGIDKDHKKPTKLVLNDLCQQYFQWIIMCGVGLMLGLGLAYLVILNSLATMGFGLENLKGETLALKKEIEQWDIDLSVPSSLYAMESYEEVQAMEPIKRKTFVTVHNGEVAMLVDEEL